MGMYSTVHEPSRLSIQFICASDGPSTDSPRPPTPAPLVSTVNVLTTSVIPFSNPGPNALHLLGSQPLITVTLNGDPGMGTPS